MNKDSRGYWYRSQRIGGRVVREYIGKGGGAELFALIEDGDIEQRRVERLQREASLQRHRVLDSEIEAYYSQVTAITREVLQLCGYHQHARGQWRKKRMTEIVKVDTGKFTKEEQAFASRISSLLKKADHSAEARREIFEMLEERGITKSWVRMQCMAAQAERSLLKGVYGADNPFAMECEEKNLDFMRKEIQGENATPLEKMLAARIVVCWLSLQHYEAYVAQNQNMSLAVGDYHHKKIDRAHKRYLSAIKTLAEVRKMQLPNVQVNIGEKQINIV